MDIVFVDLLYQPKGSFDDDFITIEKAVEGKSVFHLRVESKDGVRALLWAGVCIWQMSPRRVVFLSAKMWHLILMLPLALFFPVYAIYHFRPNVRGRIHDFLLPLISRVYSFAAYSESVRSYLCTITKRTIPLLAHRSIDKSRSFGLLLWKLQQNQVNIFCPGIRNGVRDPLDYGILKKNIEGVIGRPVCDLVVQDVDYPLQGSKEVSLRLTSMLSDDEYARLYSDSLIIAMKFCPGYEARSSAMINDALGKGCIVLTDAHPITIQYGYPRGLVTNLEHLPHLIKEINIGKFCSAQIPGFDEGEARQSWINFLKLEN